MYMGIRETAQQPCVRVQSMYTCISILAMVKLEEVSKDFFKKSPSPPRYFGGDSRNNSDISKKFKTMAKKNIATEIQEMVAAGDATVVADNKFSGADGAPLKVRSMESTNDPLEVGDEITIPTDYKVIAVKIGEGSYPCTVAEVKGADGSERNMRFFPNSLAKNITPIDAEGRRMPKVKTTGAVASWYSQKDTVDEAMKELAGKTLVVAAKTVYSIRDYNTKEIRQTGIYQYEWKA